MSPREWVVTFPVPDEPVSINRSPRSRGGAIGWSRRTAKWRDAATAYAQEQIGGPLPPCRVRVTIPFATARKRDPMNFIGSIVKWVVDGLVNAGIWPDDDPTYVTVLEPFLVVGNEVMVVMTERDA